MTTPWQASKHPAHYGINFNPTVHPGELAIVDGHTLRDGTLLSQFKDADDDSVAARLWVGGPSTLGADPSFQELVPANVINVRSLGADPTGVTPSGAIINKAITEAIARGYGRVYIPSGQYLIEETIVMDSLVWLYGDGMSTYLRAVENLNAPMIEAYWADSVRFSYMQALTDLRLDGNRDNQSDASNAHGIVWGAPGSAGLPLVVPELVGHNYSARLPEVDPIDNWPEVRRYLNNVFVSYCAGNGITMSGRGAVRVANCVVYECQGHGFIPTYDSSYVNCESARNGKTGFYLAQSAVHLTNCKTWWSGYRKPDDIDDFATHGYQMTGSTRGCMLVSCEAQDNYASGFSFAQAIGHACYGCIADSNNRRNGDNVGVDFYESYGNVWEGICYDRYNDSIRYQDYALRFRQLSTHNRVKLQHRYYNGGASTYAQFIPHISTDTDSLQGNEIYINNQNGMQKSSSGTVTISAFHGSDVLINLSSNTTINYDGVATVIPPGAKLRFTFVQNATGGWTVTFSSSFRANWSPNTAANKINIIEFLWNSESSKWVQASAATNI